MFFLFISLFWLKMKKKARNILTFYCNSFFSLKIAGIIPFPAFLGELTSYLRKTIFFKLRRKEYLSFHEKKLLFTEEVDFSINFFLFHCFHQKNKQKTLNIATIYFFFWKKIINDVIFNVFRSINGIFNKTPFYKYNILKTLERG